MTTPRTTWLVTALIAAATFFSMFALSPLIADSGWTRAVAMTLLLSATAAVAVRVWTRSKILPTVAGALAAIVTMVPLFAMTGEGVRHVLPTPAALGGLWQALVDGVEYAATTPAPAQPTRVLVALLTAFAVALFLVADHLASSWRAVASAGAVLVLPWLPAMFLQYRVPIWALLASALCWLAAMGAARSSSVGQPMPVRAAAIAGAAAVALTLVVVPSALGGPGWGLIPRFETPRQLDTTTRLNLALDLRTSLTVDSAQPVLTYVTTGRKAPVLRLYTLTDFDGTSWAPEDEAIGEVSTATVPLWSEPVPDWQEEPRTLLDVQITSLAERNLPLPTFPRAVDVGDDWRYSPERDEVATKDGTTRGLGYRISVADEYVTEDRLRASTDLVSELPNPEQYVAIPAAVDDDRIRTLATDLTSEATTPYDSAVAIQDYLRDPKNFTYDTSVNPATGDAVSQFLDDRSGYCVQFATTMVMMARSLGMPARLGVGFLGGSIVQQGTFEVRGGDAHAWAELHFPGVGWVRFEPTPAAQTGAPPAYADVYANQVPVINEFLNRAPNGVPVPTTVPSRPPEVVPTTDVQEPAAEVPWWLIGVAVVVLVGVAVGIWLLRRRTISVAHDHGPEAAWVALHDGLPEEWRWVSSRTPHEAAEQLAVTVDAVGAGFTPTAHDGLARLANAVSDHRYAPDGTDADPAEMMQWALLVATEATASLEARNRPVRDDARSGPRSGA